MMQVIEIRTQDGSDFVGAKAKATRAAGKILRDPMLLSWLNRETGQHSPPVECCRDGDKESWEIYAESRGGSVRVEADEHYVFIFGEGLATS